MEAVCFSETLVSFKQTTRRHISDDSDLQGCKILESINGKEILHQLSNYHLLTKDYV
jgi:hypothetical protein